MMQAYLASIQIFMQIIASSVIAAVIWNWALGGDYRFIHCTVASYNNFFITHKNPVLQVSNAAMQNGATSTKPLQALFQNCIFWGDGGNVDDEIIVDKEGSRSFFSKF